MVAVVVSAKVKLNTSIISKRPQSLIGQTTGKKNQLEIRFVPKEVQDCEFNNIQLKDFEGIFKPGRIEALEDAARILRGMEAIHFNSSKSLGGGVAELLYSTIPILRERGIYARWFVIDGGGEEEFFWFTKTIHNKLQGNGINKITEAQKDLFHSVVYENYKNLGILKADLGIIHDPQPSPLIKFFKQDGAKFPIIWRCHIDTSKPERSIWNHLWENFIKYSDATVFSHLRFIPSHILGKIFTALLPPAINPLSPKNIERTEAECKAILKDLFEKYGIDFDIPIVVQISRFDPWKGWLHVVDTAKMLPDVQFILAGPPVNGVSDDPEAIKIFQTLKEKIENYENIFLVELPMNNVEENQKMVGALFRIAKVVLQLSTKEGFGLTATEALWNNGVVITSGMGGLGLQVIHGKNGYIIDPRKHSEVAQKIRELISNEVKRRELKHTAKEYVREHFLFDRYLIEWLKLYHNVYIGRLDDRKTIVDYNGWQRMAA